MTKKMTGLILLLLLAACDINRPAVPRLEGQWQCSNGIRITFRDGQNYSTSGPSGETTGVYKFTEGENNYHRIEWNPGDKEAEAPLPTRFRYFVYGNLARLNFYTQDVDGSVPCERRLRS